MESRACLESKWRSMCATGKLRTKSSFLAGSIDTEYFGALKVPNEFHEKFGETLPDRLALKCKSNLWTVKYDPQRRRLYGLRKFMKYYSLKLFNLVLFDYCGMGLFTVKLFKETAIESPYPSIHPHDYWMTEAAQNCNEEQYVLHTHSLEFQKSISLLAFNGFSNKVDYVELDVISLYLHPKMLNLILPESWERFYKNWDHGSKVFLRFVDEKWEIEVEWRGGFCTFGDGWVKFAEDAGLQAGDRIVLFKHKTSAKNILNVCVFKGEDYMNDVGEGSEECNRSFYKVVYPDAAEDGFFVVPRMVREKFNQKLRRTNKIEVDGESWFVFYNDNLGYIKNLQSVFKRFNLRERETVIFNIDDSNVIDARIYQVDGMEIDYRMRRRSNRRIGCDEWFWKVALPFDSDSEDDGDGESNVSEHENVVDDAAEDNGDTEFSVCLSDCHVSNKSHGVYIPKNINPPNRQWTSEDEITFRTNIGSWKIRLTFSHGRARFSAGWNEFKRANGLKKKDTIVFNMVEEEGLIVFDITKHQT